MPKPTLIEAVAGSGKTTKLVSHYCQILDSIGYKNADQIIAITYTNKAANEMSHRIALAIGRPIPTRIMTIHQLCAMIIRLYPFALSLPSGLTILDSGLTDALKHQAVLTCVAQWQTQQNPVFMRAIAGYSDYSLIILLTQLCNATRYITEIHAQSPTIATLMTQVNQAYQQLKTARLACDYDDLIDYANQILDTVSPPGQYLLLDEAQDTNYTQWDLLKKVIPDMSRLFIVGDRCQSIYAFQGADNRVFDTMIHDISNHSDGICIEATDNYRCASQVINFVNTLFTGWLSGFKPLIGTKSIPGNVAFGVAETLSLNDRIKATAVYLQRLRKKNPAIAWSDMAILLRKKRNIRAYRDYLTSVGIPCAVSPLGFYQQPIVRALIHTIQALSDRYNATAWVALLEAPWIQLPALAIQTLAARSESSWPEKLQAGCPTIYKQVEPLLHIDRYRGLYDWVHAIVTQLAIWDISHNQVDPAQCQANIRALLHMTQTATRADLLTQWQAAITHDTTTAQASVSEPDGVQIMTLHAAKGLEFESVILPEFDARFNIRKSPVIIHRGAIAIQAGRAATLDTTESPDAHETLYKDQRRAAIEEEKRLFYVACTRAKQWLYILTGTKNKSLTLLDSLGERFNVTDRHVLINQTAYPRVLGQTATESVLQSNAPPIYYSEPSQIQTYPKYISVSDSLAYLSCPKQLAYSKAITMISDQDPDTLALGQLVHKVFGIIIRSPNQPINQSISDAIVTNSTWQRLAKYKKKTLHAIATTFQQSALLTRISESVQWYTERAFTVWLGPICVSGRFDLVAQYGTDAAPAWWLIDFKTGRHQHSQQYQQQLQVYALAMTALGWPGPYTAGIYWCNTGLFEPIDVSQAGQLIPKFAALPDQFRSKPMPPDSPSACDRCPVSAHIPDCHKKSWDALDRLFMRPRL